MNVTNNLKLPQYTEEDIFDLQDINKAYSNIDNAYKEVIDFKNEIPKVNANAEIIDARVGQTTLGDKIRNIDTQLDTINHKITRKYGLNYFGANIWLENSYTQDTFDKIVERAVKNGFNSFLIACYNIQDLENNTIVQNRSNETIIRCINSCKKYGIENIALKCHISPNSSADINSIPNVMEIWKSRVENYANLAYDHGINTIFVSNEQINLTSSNRDVWKSIIDYCHNKGLKCFSSFANFNDFYSCCFVDLLDCIGINYYPSAFTNKITEEEVIKNLGGYEGKEYSYRFKAIKNAFPDKNLFITEIGICNNEQALLSPSKYQFDNDIPINEEIQAWYYESFLQELSKGDIGIEGIYVWSIGDSHNRTSNAIFSPLWNLSCERVIKKYMGVNENDI